MFTVRPLPAAVALPLLVFAAGAAVPAAGATPAQAAAPPAAAASPVTGPLPIREVVLFSSGVAYTQRSGEVNGDAVVPLVFRTAQINDILKSLVLLDENGTVQPATYAARDPIGRTLQSFAVDVTANLTLVEILNRLRGARVAVETADKRTVTGQIVGVEERRVPATGRREEAADAVAVAVPFLNLLGERGLTSIRIDADKTIRLLDERLNREFQSALGVLATAGDDQRRQVTLRFAGNGRRRVRVGYVTEAPLWKISYRLLLGGAAAAEGGGTAAAAIAPKPYLQGWALVENTSDEDWQNVRLSLVSGRPVSFIQDLYQPLYLPRPVVPPDVVASPYPQTNAGNLLESEERPAATPPGAGGGLGGGAAGGGRRLRDSNAPAAAAPRGAAAGRQEGADGIAAYDADASLLFRNAVVAQAAGEKAGELFQYQITTPVTLGRQQAAMIPVVAQDIDGEKVSLFNADSGSRFPLNAVRVKNTTPLHLKGGPITLFDAGVYAGDARMEDIPPGDSRLVTYAVDLDIEGERQGAGTTSAETSLSIRRGVLLVRRTERIETNYTLKNKGGRSRAVLVEHPFRPDFQLVTPKEPAERTADRYRFAVTVAPGKSEALRVVVERPVSQGLALLDTDLNTVSVYANRREIPERLRAALQEIVRRRRLVQEREAQAAAREAEINAIGQDQDRVRKNMAALDKGSALYKRYVAQLDAQETRLQTLRSDARRLRREAADAAQDLRAYLDNLDVADR